MDLLQYQIGAQNPRLILTLGRFVPALMSMISPSSVEWRKVASLVELDSRYSPVVKDVIFCSGAAHATVVALTHPTQRHLNIHRRAYKGLHGNEAELLMVKDAVLHKLD